MSRRIITTENLEEDIKIENHLRPQLLEDYIGQEKALLQYIFSASPSPSLVQYNPPKVEDEDGSLS